jgi:hypothetical protein
MSGESLNHGCIRIKRAGGSPGWFAVVSGKIRLSARIPDSPRMPVSLAEFTA